MKYFILISSLFAFVQIPGQSSLVEDWSNDSIIVGFGESSHGNCADFARKLKFARQLKSTNMKVNVLVEMPYGVKIKMISYINGLIDKTELISALELYGLQTDGFINFAQDVINDSNLRFIGIDMQHYKASFQVLLTSVNLTKLNLDKTSLRISELESMFSHFAKQPAAQDSLTRRFKSRHYKLLEIINNVQDKRIRNELKYALSNIEQCYMYRANNYLGNSSQNFRDSCMAENVKFISETIPGPIVIFAANFHVCKMATTKKSPLSLGCYVFKYFKDRYKVLISQFYSGQILSVSISPEWHTYNQSFQSIKKTLPFEIHKFYQNTDTIISVNDLKLAIPRTMRRLIYIQDMGAGGPSKYKYHEYRRAKSGSFDAVYYSKISEPCFFLGE
ncbi:MAG: hypothetical protein ACI9J3_001587 [Parvicellaceae bacterium]